MSAFPFAPSGKLTTVGGRITKTREVSADYVIDPETDYNIQVLTIAGPVQITLPVGVDGQEFFIQDAAGQAGTNPITVITSGGDIFAQSTPGINFAFGSRRFVYKAVTVPGPAVFPVWYYQEDATSGGGVTGTPNTVGFFNSSGALSSSLGFQTDESQGFPTSWGESDTGGSITATTNGSLAKGAAHNNSQIIASATGTIASGNSNDSGVLSATSEGAVAFGAATDAGSLIQSSGTGSIASGQCGNGGQVIAGGPGCLAHGTASDAGSAISAISSNGNHAHGRAQNAGVISSTQDGATAHGFVDGTGSQIVAAGIGSLVLGAATTGGVITATGSGAIVSGVVSNAGNVSAAGKSAIAIGNVDAGGTIHADGSASIAMGACSDAGSSISTSSDGTLVYGEAESGGTISVSGTASTAFGLAQNLGAISSQGLASYAFGSVSGTDCSITSGGTGSLAFGASGSTFPAFPSVITANADGAIAFGTASEGGQIQSEGFAFGDSSSDGTQFSVITAADASMAFGVVTTGGTIQSNGGGLCYGFVTDTGSLVRASGSSSLAFGRAATGGTIESSGQVSIAVGQSLAVGDPHTASGVMAFNFGQSIVNPVMLCFSHGRFASIAGSINSWVDTDPLFVLGNGTATGSESNAFQVRKDGLVGLTATITPAGTTGAQTINKASGTVNISALGSSVVVTNSLVDVNSIVLCVLRTNDATAVIKNVVPAAGSFTINLTVAATAEVSIGFVVVGQAS